MKFLVAILMLFPMLGHAETITLTTNNSCSLEGAVNKVSMNKLKLCIVNKTLKRRGRNYPIYIYVNSPGGEVYSGLQFIEFVKTIKNVKTITQFAASMAAAIVQGNPGERLITPMGISMFHRARGGFRGQFEDGELESRLKMWKNIIRGMEQMQADRIGITLKQYKKNRKDEWWVFGTANITKNVSDKMVSVRCSPQLIKRRYKSTTRTFFGKRTVEKSECPLVN